MNHYLTRKKVTRTILALAVLGALLAYVSPILAAPPTSPYNPGNTLDPNCSPGDVNCTVRIPLSGQGTSTELSFYDSSSTITSNPALTFVSSTGLFSVSGTASSTELRSPSATLTGLQFTSATGTTFFATNASTTNLGFTNASGTKLDLSTY